MSKKFNRNHFTLISCLIFLLLGGGYFLSNNIFQSANTFFETSLGQSESQTEGGKGKLSKMQASIERELHEFEKTRDPALNRVPRERLAEARSYMNRRQAQKQLRTPLPNIDWEERGPNNVGGRTRAILVDASDASGNTVWAGSVGGGLWKTSNFNDTNPTWSNINIQFVNNAITCIAQDPTDLSVLYVGTGEGFGNSDAIRGLGLYKSTDSGATWANLNSTRNSDFYYVQDLAFSSNGDLFAATKTGLHFSTSDGISFSTALNAASGASDDAADLEVGADGDLYVSFGLNNSPGSIYKSDFATFGTFTGHVGAWTNITPALNDFERIELAIAPSHPNRIYAVCQKAGTSEANYFYRSVNGGDSWGGVMSVPGFCDAGNFDPKFTRSGAKGQAWYDLIMVVDPNNPNRLFMGGVDALRSDNAGSTWTQVTGWAQNFQDFCNGVDYVHADHHAMVFVNGSSSKLILGTDGGISYTTNADVSGDTPTFTDKNLGYNVTQFYSCAMHPSSGSNTFLAGAQDNGTQRFTSPGLGNTFSFSGGDGGFCHIDQDNPNVQISAHVRNQYYLSLNGFDPSIQAFFNESGRFINPTDYDNNAKKLYCANGASDYLRWNNPSLGGTSGNIVQAGFLDQISAIICDPNVSNRVWMGDGLGNIYLVENADTNTPAVTTFAAPSMGYVSSIDIDPANGNRLLVCRSNYGVVSVYEVTISGSTATWTNIENNIPDMPVRWGIFNPINSDQALIATELSVWSTTDIAGTSTDWDPTINEELLSIRVDMLQYRASDMTIAAATHGRGLFTSLLSPYPAQSNPSACQLSLPIPDASCTAYNKFPIKVTDAPGTDLGTDVFLTNVKLIIEHTYDADLDIRLISPNGTVVELSTDNGSSADNYGDPTDVTCTEVTDFSMDAPTSITSGTAPFIGTYIPEGDFADFHDGSSANGVWFLEICDDAGQDTGALAFVELALENPYTCTMLAGPVNGATNVTLGSDLSWAPATDALGYLLSVGTSPGGTDILNNLDLGDVTTYDPPNDFPAGTTIYVTVSPYSELGTAPLCGEVSFTTTTNEEGCLTTLFAAEAAGNGGMFKITNNGIYDLMITSFEANMEVEGTNETFRVYYTNGNTHVDVERNSLAWTLLGDTTAISMGDGHPTTIPIGGLILPPGTSKGLYVTNTGDPTMRLAIGSSVFDDGILEMDMSEGRGNIGLFDAVFGSIIWNGTICYEVTVPPDCTALVSPANSAINVPVNSPLTWSAATGAPTGYRLSIGTTMGGTDIVNDLDVGHVLTYNPVANFPFDTTLFVTITPYNTSGDAVGCMEESFMTGNPILSNPSACLLDLPISDNTCTSANQFRINVTAAPGTQLGTDVELTNAKLIVEHPFDQDLTIKLSSPSGQVVQLVITQGGSDDNFGDPTDMTCTAVTDFTMDAVNFIYEGTAPFIGSYRPHVGDFADFNDGSNPNGIWILEVCDNSASDVGELEYVELVFGTDLCDVDLVLSGDITPNAYYADNSITSDGRVTSGTVEFYALMSVLLSPEFEVQAGAEFLAVTGIGCTPLPSPDLPEGFKVAAPSDNSNSTKADQWLSLRLEEGYPNQILAQIYLLETEHISWYLEDLVGNLVYELPTSSSSAVGKHEYLLTLPDLGLKGEYVLTADDGTKTQKVRVKF